ncbi:DUF418 domain-containing protein [Nocardiopsis sp. NPDC058789]|uniref:DUF418 domain-containing protein n=1 Tax=Nocardiopsis sp. NPDC058789 TaxID=3346634 RepID=UPI00366A637F
MDSSRGPVAARGRALGPDLARGVMLLCIALANSHYFLRGDAHLGGFPLDGDSVDRAVSWAIATFVDGRAFPMFGLLFGYGVALLVGRATTGDRPAARRLLWRRAAVLVVVGVVDGFLFYAGDILAMYGVLLLVGSFAVFWRDRWLLAVAALFLLLTSLPDAGVFGTEGPDPVLLPPDPVVMLTDRAAAVALVSLLGPIGFAAPFLVGLWAGRRRMLEREGRHRWLLVATAVVGPVVAVLGAQPLALAVAGVVPVPPESDQAVLGALHGASGIAGGFGYAALIALVALRIERRPDPGPVVTALASAGQRSMTCYLAQSPVWAVVFTPFLLDLSGTLTVTSTALLATGVWLATVVLSDRMRRAGRRGPFETLVRRVTYGPAPGAAPKVGQEHGS